MNQSCIINVLHIASGDLWAGAEVQLYTLAKALNKRQDTNITVVLLNHGMLEKKLVENGVHVTVLDESKLNAFKILRRLITTIHKEKPDVIHTHRVKENILGSLAALVHNTPTVRTTHGAPEHKPAWQQIPKRLILFIDWFCGRFLQKKIIAVSDDLAEILNNDYPAEKIKVIENGIDLTSFTTRPKPVQPGFEDGNPTFRIGVAGRLVPVKRVDLFIETAAELLNTHPELNIIFKIIGDGPLRTELVALSRRLNTENNVMFEGHCDNIKEELASLDALLITSDHEGLPMILLEAMALETPVIAHAVGGIPAVLNHGECGLIISDQRATAYADAIMELISNIEVRREITQNALTRVTAAYSSNENATAYYKIYIDVIKNHRQR